MVSAAKAIATQHGRKAERYRQTVEDAVEADLRAGTKYPGLADPRRLAYARTLLRLVFGLIFRLGVYRLRAMESNAGFSGRIARAACCDQWNNGDIPHPTTWTPTILYPASKSL